MQPNLKSLERKYLKLLLNSLNHDWNLWETTSELKTFLEKPDKFTSPHYGAEKARVHFKVDTTDKDVLVYVAGTVHFIFKFKNYSTLGRAIAGMKKKLLQKQTETLFRNLNQIIYDLK